jgi:hypothetical protein
MFILFKGHHCLSDTADTVQIQSAPTTLQRWIGAVPMFLTFYICTTNNQRLFLTEQYFNDLRISLPLLAKIAVGWAHFTQQYAIILMPGMFAIAWIYFWSVGKSRKHLMMVNLVLTICCLLAVMTILGGNIMAQIKIDDACRKK